MKPIDINLSAQPYRNDTPLWAGLALLMASAVGLTVYNGWHFTTSKQRIEALTSELAGHRQSMEAMKQENDKLTSDLKAIDADLYATQVEFVNEILTQRNFSWTRLFNALEDVVPWDVRLTAIRPVFEQGRVAIQVSGVSRNYDALLKFEEEVERYPQFDGLTPGDFNRGDAGDQIYFNLSFNYRPDAVEELPPEGEISAANQASDVTTPGSIRQSAEAAPDNEPAAAPSGLRPGAAGQPQMGAVRRAQDSTPLQSASDAAMGDSAQRAGDGRMPLNDPRAPRPGRGRPDGNGPDALEEESTFGGEFIPGQAGGARGGNNTPGGAQPGRTPRPLNPNAGGSREAESAPPEDPNRPRRPSVDPNEYITYDQNGKPILRPFTRDNPPPKKDGGGGSP